MVPEDSDSAKLNPESQVPLQNFLIKKNPVGLITGFG